MAHNLIPSNYYSWVFHSENNVVTSTSTWNFVFQYLKTSTKYYVCINFAEKVPHTLAGQCYCGISTFS